MNAGWRLQPSGQTDLSRPLALLVEDSPDILRTTGVFLEAAGFEVVRASNGEAALVPLASGQDFALLVTDFAMPGLNGLELTMRALKTFPSLKVLIITGYPDTRDLADLPAGVAMLMKPFSRVQLIAQLKSWFDEA